MKISPTGFLSDLETQMKGVFGDIPDQQGSSKGSPKNMTISERVHAQERQEWILRQVSSEDKRQKPEKMKVAKGAVPRQRTSSTDSSGTAVPKSSLRVRERSSSEDVFYDFKEIDAEFA